MSSHYKYYDSMDLWKGSRVAQHAEIDNEAPVCGLEVVRLCHTENPRMFVSCNSAEQPEEFILS
jgi:hypothetical protein